MSRLDELIQQLCPDGVNYSKLDCLLDYEQPTKYIVRSTEYDASYDVPVLTAGQSFILGYTDETDNIYIADKEKPVIIFDDFTTSFHWVDFNFKVKSSAMKMLFPKSSDFSFRYVYYAMCCIGFIPSDHARHWISKYSQFEIPLPPLPVQEEIVRILDKFTQVTAELKAELKARKDEYDYYRNQLLTFDASRTDVEWKKISDICSNICSGGTPSTSHEEYYHGNIPWLRTQEVDWKEIYDTEVKITEDAIANSSAKIIPANCVIVAMYGATAAKVAINRIPLSTNQACCNLEVDSSKALVKYVYQWFCKEYNKLKSMGEGSQNNINGKKVKDYPIPIPPLAEQQRIVDILDRFEKLTNDMTEGIPAEIEATQQMYEYYRDKLLTFKKKED